MIIRTCNGTNWRKFVFSNLVLPTWTYITFGYLDDTCLKRCEPELCVHCRFPRLVSLLVTKTKSPTWKFGLRFSHFWLSCNRLKYLVSNVCIQRLVSNHQYFRHLPKKRTRVIGRSFIIFSTSIMSAVNVSSFTSCSPIMLCNILLIDRLGRFHTPP